MSELLATPPLAPLMRAVPRWRGVLVLNYHRVGSRAGEPWDHALWNATAETFDAHVSELARAADVVSVADLPELARTHRRGRMVLLTFDDGYRDNHDIAFPILRRHGVPATFFVSTGTIDRPRVSWWDEIAWMVRHAQTPVLESVVPGAPGLSLSPEHADVAIAAIIAHYKTLPAEQTESLLRQVAEATGSGRCDAASLGDLWLTWDMVREMRRAGMDIGGHTVTHPILARLPEAEQADEISICAARLSFELGEPMRWFAYPVGSRDSFTPATQRLLHERGVELAFSFYGGFARFERWQPLDVPRIHVPYEANPALLQAALRLPSLFARP